jgi:hypothetical protein
MRATTRGCWKPRLHLTGDDARSPNAMSTAHRQQHEDAGSEDIRREDARARPPPFSTTVAAPFSGSTVAAPFSTVAAAPPSSTDPHLHPPWRRRLPSPSDRRRRLRPPWLPRPLAPTTASTRAASTEPSAPSSMVAQPPSTRPQPGIATLTRRRDPPSDVISTQRPGSGPDESRSELGDFLFLKIIFSYQSTPAVTKYA